MRRFLNTRMKFCEMLAGHLGDIPAPDGLGGDTTLLDFEVSGERVDCWVRT